MKKRTFVIALLILVMAFFQLGLAQGNEVKVPLSEIKSSCYGKIDMSKTEFLLSEVGRDCVTEEWLTENAKRVEAETKAKEGKRELPANTTFQSLDNLWAIGSRESGHDINDQFFKENSISFLGGKMSYAYENLDSHSEAMRHSNLIVLFNPLAEPLSVLEDWPEEYQELFPFKIDQITNYHPPYLWFKETSEGYLRGILVANSEADLLNILGDIHRGEVPVGVPVGYERDDFYLKPNVLEEWVEDDAVGEKLTNTPFEVLDDLWALGSEDCGWGVNDEFFKENATPFLGGQMAYLYENLGSHIDSIRHSNYILLFNQQAEPFSVLEEWPDQYKEVFPFEVDKLSNYQSPYIWFKESSGGYLQGIVVADTESKLFELFKKVSGGKVPVGVPVSYEEGTFYPKQEVS